MRINRYIAQSTGVGRRVADAYIDAGRVLINGIPALLGQELGPDDVVHFDGKAMSLPGTKLTLLLNKPVGYVCSRNGQGSPTIYELLPPAYHQLKSIGRLDKDSSGLLLLTTDGELAHRLTHPSYEKTKVYNVALDQPLQLHDRQKIERGVTLEDGISALALEGSDRHWTASLHEGRNRQVRRTFAAIGYTVTKLHRTQFDDYVLGELLPGDFKEVNR
jgi:23S rRNA pseudouridine2605 synthase